MTDRKSKRNPLANNIGSISHATMRPEDLVPRFISEMESQHPLHREHRKLVRDIKRNMRTMKSPAYFDNEQVQWDLDELFSALDSYCLPYFYFGAHPGDGSDYGYWLSEDFRDQFEYDGGLVVNDTGDVPKGYVGEVLHVSDHGNMTLYVASTRGLREIWAIV